MIAEQTVVQATIPMSCVPDAALNTESVVYFIGCAETKTVKIGVSVAPEMRLDSLRTGCPYPLEILATISGDRRTEMALHRRFASLGIGGEWFKDEGELRELIARVAAGERVELEPAGPLPLPGFEPETVASGGRLTVAQRAVLTWIHDLVAARGYAPTARELNTQFGLGARDHIDALVRKGCVDAVPGKARAMVVTPRGVAETKHAKGVTGWIELSADRCQDCHREFFGDAMVGHECSVVDLMQREPDRLDRRHS